LTVVPPRDPRVRSTESGKDLAAEPRIHNVTLTWRRSALIDAGKRSALKRYEADLQAMARRRIKECSRPRRRGSAQVLKIAVRSPEIVPHESTTIRR
jgi:hypothetical protein